MSIEEALYYELANDSDVAAIVGTRIHAEGETPQATALPKITYQRISTLRHGHQGGATALVEARYQVNCLARREEDAFDLADEVRDVLHYFSGNLGESGSTVDVKVAWCDTDQNTYEPPDKQARQRGVHAVISDYMICYVEA